MAKRKPFKRGAKLIFTGSARVFGGFYNDDPLKGDDVVEYVSYEPMDRLHRVKTKHGERLIPSLKQLRSAPCP